MKLIFRDLTTPQVQFKQGSNPVMTIVSGLTGMGSSYLQGEYSAANVDKQLKAQKQENQLNRDWQTEQAELNRQFQSGLFDQSYENQLRLGQLQQYYTQQNMAKQAEYNSPVYQSQELKKAGINPQVYFGQSSSFSGSSAPAGSIPGAQGVPSGSMPGSVSGLSPVGYQPPNLQIGQILKDFADARKSMSETQTNDLLRDPLYKEVIVKLKNQELVNEYQQLSNYIFKNIKDVKIRREFIELSKAEAGLVLSQDEHEINEFEKKYKSSLTRLNDMLTSLHSSEGILLGLKIKNFDKTLQSELATQASERAKNYANASESRNNAAVLEQEKRIREISANIKEKSQVDELNSIVSGLKAKKAISDQQEADAVKELAKINKIISSYNNSDAKLKVDAVLDNFFKIIGLNVSASVHN